MFGDKPASITCLLHLDGLSFSWNETISQSKHLHTRISWRPLRKSSSSSSREGAFLLLSLPLQSSITKCQVHSQVRQTTYHLLHQWRSHPATLGRDHITSKMAFAESHHTTIPITHIARKDGATEKSWRSSQTSFETDQLSTMYVL